MRITIVAHPKSSQEKVVPVNERYFDVYFNVVPEKGKANKKIIEMMSEHLGVPKSSISFYGGEKSKLKVLEIDEY